MNDKSGQGGYGATHAAALEQLFERRSALGPRPRFVVFLLLCLLLHFIIVAVILWHDRLVALNAPPLVEEIPVEVVVEPPPPPEAPPKEEPPPPPERQQQQKPPPPPPQAPTKLEDPAFDAPKAESKSKSEVDAQEQKELKTPRNEPPTDKTAQKVEKPEGLKDALAEDEGAKPDPAPEKPLDDKADAEIIERAEPSTEPKDKPEPADKKPAKKGEGKSIADQVAALAPLPNFQLAAPPKPSPVGGGQAKTTYLTILYGLIMPHMHIPPRVRAMQIPAKGIVAFYIDEMGNLTHQAVYKSSGAPDLDAAALMAVRRAAPFPPPPRGLPHSMLFTYATK
jgi:protein TonB